MHKPELSEISSGADERLQAGLAVHNVFRTLYPDGIYVDAEVGLGEALLETERLMGEGTARIFEATFSFQDVLVRVDLLEKNGEDYQLYEVKSSTAVKDYHISDLAVQAWVIRGNNVPLSMIYVAHINNSFVYPGGGDYHGLFAAEDVTSQVTVLEQEIPARIEMFRTMLSGNEPAVEPGDQCYNPFECPYCSYCCQPKPDFEYPVEILPASSRVEKELLAEGVTDLRHVPRERLTNERHLRIWDAVTTGRSQVDPALRHELQQITFPRYYLDFETIMFAIPIWAGTRPFQQLPFQYSCHVEQSDGDFSHLEFLDTSGNPPMRPLAEKMLTDLGTEGPIITYGHFERMIIGILIGLYPDLKAQLEALQERIIDLLPLLRKYYYHPDMDGSWSIKAVLPTIAPDLNYATLEEVSNGMEAQAAFLEAIHPSTSSERREALRQNMLTYCGLDSLAMQRIVCFFK